MKKRNASLLALLLSASISLISQSPFSAEDLLALKYAGSVSVSPDGTEIIYSESTPRNANEQAGSAHRIYYRMNLEDGSRSELFPRDIKGSSPSYSPDGSRIAFLHKAEGSDFTQVWSMDLEGGDLKLKTMADNHVSSYRWQPGSRVIAYRSKEAATAKEQELNRRGYGFITYEENLKNVHLYLAQYGEEGGVVGQKQLTSDMMCWDFEFNAQGTHIATSLSPKNLIDHRYAFRKVYLIDLESGQKRQVSQNEGKLGNYVFSPDGSKLAYAAALNINDHAVSQAFVCDLESGEVQNFTPEKYRGHVSWVHWSDDAHLLYLASEGVYPRLYRVKLKKQKRELLLDAAENGLIFGSPSFNAAQSTFVFSASTPYDRGNLYTWDGKAATLEQLTDLNPVLKERSFGKQEVIRYTARDGMEIEGLLIHPQNYRKDESYPLVVYVHGGPESHHSNGWLTRYSTPGQVMAGRGYLVLYVNYRASTGYGVDFGMEGFGDPAGKEFDDIADAIDWAVAEKGADRKRVGLAGGSYGGYASAWFATYYTDYVRAVCMFVGISNLISKRGTTDIPYEELYVHSGRPLEEMWQENLERSPVYWAHQSKTATLIYGGAADTRVHPSQSMELYRRMKMNNHPAVRLVQYPGEGHGNRKQAGRIDVLHRQMAWLDWYVKEAQPLDGPMPPLDISDRYGLDWDF